ncbi:ATP-dependent RNA helicase [Venturia nashicola]|nr:ATP-dependent RNA helicase [Venturia nashicola]
MPNQSDESTPEIQDAHAQALKRKASQAGLDATGQTRAVKRRASKACQCCRARKVRCNVTEHGAPCTNCRLDEVECVVSESRRKKKWSKDGEAQPEAESSAAKAHTRKLASRSTLDGLYPSANANSLNSRKSHDHDTPMAEHVPHSIYQTTGQRLSLNMPSMHRRASFGTMPPVSPYPIMHHSPMSTESLANGFFSHTRVSSLPNIPHYIKPLPARIGPDEAAYLEKKGALTVPGVTLRNELLKAYIEFVHPYMPLVDLYEFVMIVESGNGVLGRISLILFQSVMFAGCAFVDMQYLHNAGYLTRKEARKDFFQKTRLLYDFDYESDRVSLVQALLLLTYYYETPDDQKDTWHWMGVATSVAHTIGLHRNPERSNMSEKKTKLWKRIWWSTYMRDRLIALGMRRPTRIKAEDYDVPMLTLDDFDLVAIPDSVTCVPADCYIARDMVKQRQLAIMCIEKAKLCLCISHVLSKQYCVLNNHQGLVNDRTTMMLLPKKLDPGTCEVKACDDELEKWLEELPEEAQRQDTFSGDAAIDLNRALLHMVFFTTLSALHRPQVLPSAVTAAPSTPGAYDLLDTSRRNVRRAATAITSLAQMLDSADLVKYLPTTGVTVLLPAIIIHLLDIKAPEEDTRRESLRGFCQCMQVMGQLRDLYAAADYSTAFLEAAIRKAGIHIAPFVGASAQVMPTAHMKLQPVNTVEDLVDAGRRMDIANMPPPARTTLTPPPDVQNGLQLDANDAAVTDEEVARRLETFLASTPPDSDHASDHHDNSSTPRDSDPTHSTKGELPATLPDMQNSNSKEDFRLFSTAVMPDFEPNEFDAILNFDAVVGQVGEGAWSFDDGGVHGFTVDMDWFGYSGGGNGLAHGDHAHNPDLDEHECGNQDDEMGDLEKMENPLMEKRSVGFAVSVEG